MIGPALTAEEWEDVPRSLEGEYDDSLYSLCSPGLTVEKLPEINSSPHKFTREDVETLRFVADANERDNIALWGEREYDSEGRSAIKQLRVIADRIAALLPPES